MSSVYRKRQIESYPTIRSRRSDQRKPTNSLQAHAIVKDINCVEKTIRALSTYADFAY